MDSTSPGTGVPHGFRADQISMEEMRQKLIEVRDYFQTKVNTLTGLETGLQDSFFGGHEGETGAFQRDFQVFGHEWNKQFKRMLVLDQRFVALINEHGEAVKAAAAMYASADENARLKLQSILDDVIALPVEDL